MAAIGFIMGNAPSTPLGNCLMAAVGNDTALIAYPEDPFYQPADVRPYNLDLPVNPAAVAYPQTPEQVSALVQCAAAEGVKVQARSGGHSYANYCLGGEDGALVISLENFRGFEYEEATQHARFGGGTLLRDVTRQLNDHGRAMAHGTCPQVGIGGHATIGGLGPASRMWGGSLDHVVSVEVVLADGSIVRASEQENPDLLFALKGAGAGFGVITEFEVLTHEAPGTVVEYNFAFNWGQGQELADAFITWQDFITTPDLDRRFASQFIVTPIGAVISGTYFGTEEEFNQLNTSGLFPHAINDTTIVFDDWLGVVAHWAENVALELVGGIPSNFYSQNLPFREGVKIPEQGVRDLFQYIDETDKDTPAWFVIFDLEGGAINDVPLDATGYSHRDVTFYMQSYGVGLFGLSDTTRNFITGVTDSITSSLPGVEFGSYPGYVDPGLGDRAQSAYWQENLPRLEQVKRKFDPNDIFHNPQSVRPAAS